MDCKNTHTVHIGTTLDFTIHLSPLDPNDALRNDDGFGQSTFHVDGAVIRRHCTTFANNEDLTMFFTDSYHSDEAHNGMMHLLRFIYAWETNDGQYDPLELNSAGSLETWH